MDRPSWQLLEALAGEALVAHDTPACGAISDSNSNHSGALSEMTWVAENRPRCGGEGKANRS